jgi:hypothetical protein
MLDMARKEGFEAAMLFTKAHPAYPVKAIGYSDCQTNGTKALKGTN